MPSDGLRLSTTERGGGVVRPLDRERYARHLVLPEVGEQGQRRLLSSSVAVIGAGGLGAPVLLYLAAAGVGRLTVIDDDVVDRSNLQRQVLFRAMDVGRPKTDVAVEALHALNPEIVVDGVPSRLTPDNALDVLDGHDLVIDATDSIPARYLLDDACALLGLPWIHASLHRFEGRVALFDPATGPGYRDLHPEPPPPGAIQGCGEVGVLGAVPGVIGSMQAALAIDVLLGRADEAFGRLTLVDVHRLETRHLRFARDPRRDPPSNLDAARTVWDNNPTCAGRHLEGGPASRDVSMIQSMDASTMLARMRDGWTPFVLDVRSGAEHDQLSASSCDLHVPHTAVLGALNDLPQEGDILVHCKLGGRSMMAVMALIQAGVPAERLWNLDGGIEAWNALAPEMMVRG
jgi:molybdopterin/thiamine biosynthesis adenylyltransferase/rhodanese-related sulfurtransferase